MSVPIGVLLVRSSSFLATVLCCSVQSAASQPCEFIVPTERPRLCHVHKFHALQFSRAHFQLADFSHTRAARCMFSRVGDMRWLRLRLRRMVCAGLLTRALTNYTVVPCGQSEQKTRQPHGKMSHPHNAAKRLKWHSEFIRRYRSDRSKTASE